MDVQSQARIRLALRVLTASVYHAPTSESDLEALRALALPNELHLRDDQLACLVIQRELAQRNARAAGA